MKENKHENLQPAHALGAWERMGQLLPQEDQKLWLFGVDGRYDFAEWSADFKRQFLDTLGDLFFCYRNGCGRFLHTHYAHAMIIAIYADFGLKPMNYIYWNDENDLWRDACKLGDDALAQRLLLDGFDPDAKDDEGHHPGHWYAKKYRANIPKTWAWFCQRELTKTAAKARKRSWASGALVEPRAL